MEASGAIAGKTHAMHGRDHRVSGADPIGGTVTDTYELVGAATANATVVNAGAVLLAGWFLSNSNTTADRYVKLYDLATTPSSSDTPKISMRIPAGASANVLDADSGIVFSTGLAFRTVTGAADNNNTSIGSTEVIVNLFYTPS